MKKIVLIALSIMLSLPLFAQFTADMVFTQLGKQRNFKVFSDETRYRYEFNEDGQEGAVIVNNQTQDFFLIMPQQKVAIKSKAISEISMSADPLKIYDYYMEKGGTEKTIGTENVNGYKCTQRELYDENGNLLHTIWYSEEYNFPVKMVSNIDIGAKTQMEIKNIKSWKPDPEKFKVPQGYTIMDQMMMTPGR